jgi:hypothetical protein
VDDFAGKHHADGAASDPSPSQREPTANGDPPPAPPPPWQSKYRCGSPKWRREQAEREACYAREDAALNRPATARNEYGETPEEERLRLKLLAQYHPSEPPAPAPRWTGPNIDDLNPRRLWVRVVVRCVSLNVVARGLTGRVPPRARRDALLSRARARA